MHLNVGRQEHIIAVLISIFDHIAAIGFSQDMSVVWETTYRDCSRRIETIHVKPPRRKTVISARLVVLGSSSFERTGIGRTAVAMSVAMFMPALANLLCDMVR